MRVAAAVAAATFVPVQVVARPISGATAGQPLGLRFRHALALADAVGLFNLHRPRRRLAAVRQ